VSKVAISLRFCPVSVTAKPYRIKQLAAKWNVPKAIGHDERIGGTRAVLKADFLHCAWSIFGQNKKG